MLFCLKKFCSIVFLFNALSLSAQDFVSMPIPDSVWTKMQGKSYVPNPNIQRSDLRYLKVLHWDYDNQPHHGELICNKLIANKLITIFKELYRLHYPIEKIRLPDEYDADDERQMRDNNTSCFNYRTVPGSKKLSKHALGLAIDINPLYNPYIRTRKDGSIEILPANAKPYANRKAKFLYKLEPGDPCHRLFLQHGFTWGGSWRTSKDYQHFQSNTGDGSFCLTTNPR